MTRRWMTGLLTAVVGFSLWAGTGTSAQAQQPMNRFYYYPYYYFPHNYWPSQGPQWPEPVGAPYQRPPAYMAYPPYLESGWRYDLFESHKYYRGFHFWLDQF
jgi:hypothetical protein